MLSNRTEIPEANPHMPSAEQFRSLVHEVVKKESNTQAFDSWTYEELWAYLNPLASRFPQIVKEKNQTAIELFSAILPNRGGVAITKLKEEIQLYYKGAIQWEEQQESMLPFNPNELLAGILERE